MPRKKINENIRSANRNLIREKDLEQNIRLEINKEINKK